MAFTKQQEAFLAAFADAGLAEQADAERRNLDIERSTKVSAARETMITQLKSQQDADFHAALVDFDTNVAPTID